MGYWEFIWHFWWQILSFSYRTAEIISFFLLPIAGLIIWVWRTKKWEKRMKDLKWILPLIAFLLLLMAPITPMIISYNIYKDQQAIISNKDAEIKKLEGVPELSYYSDPTVSYSDDEEKGTRTYTVNICVTNTGERTAYQLTSRICFAPENQPQNIIRIIPNPTIANSLQANENIPMPPVEFTIKPIKEKLLMYHQLICTDNATGGNTYHFYKWYKFSSETPITLMSLSREESSRWEPFINANIEKTDK